MAKVRLAILGCGGMAGAHAERFRDNADVEIVALCDVAEEVVEKFIERNLPAYEPKPAIYTEAARMYAEAQLDAVAIISPHTLHFQHGMQAIEAGCHVLMEKPMVTDSVQAKELAATVEKSRKIFVVGYNTPCTPAFRYLRDIVRSGELGKLETVTAWMSQDWRRFTVGTWRQDPALSGGGMMYDSGAHLFNSLVWTLERNVADVFAFADNVGTPVDINGTVNIRFEDGVMAAITIAGNTPGGSCLMCLTFDGGRVEIDAWSGEWIRVWKGEQQIDAGLTGEAETPNDNFIDAILGRAEPQTSPVNGVIQSQLMDAIYESVETGRIAHPVND